MTSICQYYYDQLNMSIFGRNSKGSYLLRKLDYAIVFLFKNLVHASLCSSSFFLLIIGPVIILYTELHTSA